MRIFFCHLPSIFSFLIPPRGYFPLFGFKISEDSNAKTKTFTSWKRFCHLNHLRTILKHTDKYININLSKGFTSAKKLGMLKWIIFLSYETAFLQGVAILTWLTWQQEAFFFSQAACEARQLSLNCRSSHQKEEFPSERALPRERGAVNHCSALTPVSEQLWTCTTQLKNPPGWHPSQHSHQPPFKGAERIGVNQQSDLKWETLKRRERKPLFLLPFTSLTNQSITIEMTCFHLECKRATASSHAETLRV